MKHLFLAGENNIAKRDDIREKIRQAKLKYATRPCGTCGVIIKTTPWALRERKNQFCGNKCLIAWRKARVGTKSAHWKGGKVVDKLGYVLLYSPNHPAASKKGYVREHRLVMENKLGRYLTNEEIVHHLDYSKDNNSSDNLVLTTRKEHLVRYHYDDLINRLPRKEQ